MLPVASSVWVRAQRRKLSSSDSDALVGAVFGFRLAALCNGLSVTIAQNHANAFIMSTSFLFKNVL